MNSRGGLGVALLVLFVPAIGIAALASFLWQQQQSSFALEIELPEQPLAVRSFEVDGIDGWLVRREDGEVDAFWANSPHRGCTVELAAAGDERLRTVPSPFGDDEAGFLDPCGNSRWRLSGERVFGPAPRGLDRFPVAEGEAAILIDLGRVLLGVCARGTTATRCSGEGLPRTADGPRR